MCHDISIGYRLINIGLYFIKKQKYPITSTISIAQDDTLYAKTDICRIILYFCHENEQNHGKKSIQRIRTGQDHDLRHRRQDRIRDTCKAS